MIKPKPKYLFNDDTEYIKQIESYARISMVRIRIQMEIIPYVYF